MPGETERQSKQIRASTIRLQRLAASATKAEESNAEDEQADLLREAWPYTPVHRFLLFDRSAVTPHIPAMQNIWRPFKCLELTVVKKAVA